MVHAPRAKAREGEGCIIDTYANSAVAVSIKNAQTYYSKGKTEKPVGDAT